MQLISFGILLFTTDSVGVLSVPQIAADIGEINTERVNCCL